MSVTGTPPRAPETPSIVQNQNLQNSLMSKQPWHIIDGLEASLLTRFKVKAPGVSYKHKTPTIVERQQEHARPCTQPNLKTGFAGSSSTTPILRSAALKAHASPSARSPVGILAAPTSQKHTLLLLQLKLQETKSWDPVVTIPWRATEELLQGLKSLIQT